MAADTELENYLKDANGVKLMSITTVLFWPNFIAESE